VIYGLKWKDWGVARLEAMKPFCGHGFITVDGEDDWKRYRRMLATFLAESNVLELASLESTLEKSLRRLPKTGEIVDFSPILDELVSLALPLSFFVQLYLLAPSAVSNTICSF
jgi:pilus assembly protein TadC